MPSSGTTNIIKDTTAPPLDIRAPIPKPRSMLSRLSGMHSLAPQRVQYGTLQIAAVEHVVRIKRNEPLSIGMGDVNAGFLDAADVETHCIDKLHDDHAEDTAIVDALGRLHLGQAAQEF